MRPHRGEHPARAIKRKQGKGKREKGKEKAKVGHRAPAALPVPSQNTTISWFSDLKMTIVCECGFIFCGNLNHQNFVHMSGDAPPTYGAESSEWVYRATYEPRCPANVRGRKLGMGFFFFFKFSVPYVSHTCPIRIKFQKPPEW